MTKKTKKDDSKMKDEVQLPDWNYFYEDEQKFLEGFIISDIIFETVISQLKIDHSDELFKNLIYGMLKRKTKSHIVFTIWNNISDEQLKEFNSYLEKALKIAPWMESDDVLILFARDDEGLTDKINKSLDGFFEAYVKNFNEISEA